MNTLCMGVGTTASWGQNLPTAPSIDDDGWVNRDVLTRNLRNILRSGDVAGAVIEGERGCGKRHAIETAVSREAYAGTVYRLAGTRYGQEIEFGALHFLLFDLQDDQIVSPIIVFSELRKCFEGGPSKPVFIIENHTFMDQWSITVLSQLAQAGLIRIFVIDDKEAALNEDINALVRSEALAHWRILPLTFAETENRINALTGLSPSPLATASLWTYSEGNAEWLDALMDDGLEQGNLVRSVDSLLMATDGIVVGRKMLEVARSWLDRLSSVQRQALEAVAREGIIAPRQLDPEQLTELDPLYERGLLEYVREPAAGVRLASRVLGDSLRSMQAGGRRVGLGRHPENQIHFDTASGNSATLGPLQLLSTGFEKYIRDMVQAGRVKQALLRVSQERTRFFGALPDVSCDQSGPYQLSRDALNVLSLELQLALQSGDVALVGRLIAVIDSARNGFRLHHASSHEFHAAAATLLEALAFCNRDTEAAELATWLTEVCLQRNTHGTGHETEPCFSTTIRALLIAFLRLGEWDSCRDLAVWVLNSRLRDPHVIAFANIVEAVLAAVAGDVETARTRLVPVERQLLLAGPSEDHTAIAAILAYCQLTTGFSADAARILPPEATAVARTTCFGWVAHFFWVTAVSMAYSPESGRRQLLALLDDSASQVGSMFRLHTLALLLRMGDPNAASALREACHGNRGIFAEAYGLLAGGVLDKRSAPIVRGLQMLTDFGFAEYAAEQENHLHPLISASQRRMIARSRSLQRPATAVAAEEQEGSMDQIRVFDLLTKRERFVAAAAARGLSNLEIADKASVSVRTVEGHLYQVYSKLTIQGRSELHSLAASLLRKPADSHV